LSAVPCEVCNHVTPYRVAPRTLARASLAAAVGSAVVLVLFILPAEWGIDATGVGRALGLTRMANTEEESAASPTPATVEQNPGRALEIPPQTMDSVRALTAFRSDRRTIVLPSHSGHEIKAHMRRGDHLVFRWSATSPVRMDMHGEPSGGDAEEFTSYWKQKNLSTAQGQFTAPFDGTHGWYWRNGGDATSTIEIETAGFYADLFEPSGQ
jgi:hypothetical protein